MLYPVLRSTIKFVHAIQSLYNRGCISVKMSATPLSRQNSEEVKVIIRCVVKGYQECLFDVDIGEEFEIKSKIGSKGRAFKLCNNRGQLGHLQRELVAPLWPLARQLSNSKWYVNLPSHIFIPFFYYTCFPRGVILLNIFVKSRVLQVHLIASYLTALSQEKRSMIRKVDGKKVEGLTCQ